MFLQVGGEKGGNRLTVDGAVGVHNWDVRKAILDRATLQLTAGRHKVVVERTNPGAPDVFGGNFRLGIAPQDTLVNPAARTLATQADVVVVAVGWDATIETEGGDRTLACRSARTS